MINKSIDYIYNIKRLILALQDEHVERIAKIVYQDERFPIWSGSSKDTQHHYGKGGLAQHTWEVIESSMLIHEYYHTGEDKRKVFLAALFHDCGKMWDYEPVTHKVSIDRVTDMTDWQSTQHKYRIHHLPKSAIEWCKAVEHCDKFIDSPFKEWEDDITHAILAHHGLRAWGSPVEPKTSLAWILHLCDNMSARIYEAKEL